MPSRYERDWSEAKKSKSSLRSVCNPKKHSQGLSTSQQRLPGLKHVDYLLDDLAALSTALLGFLHFVGVLALGILLRLLLVGTTLLLCVADQSLSESDLRRGGLNSKCSLSLRSTGMSGGCS